MITQSKYTDLSGKTAIVTGGATGIGEAITRAFCEQGTAVAILDIDEAAGGALADAMNAAHPTGRCAYLPCDLNDIEALRDAVATSGDLLGPASILVNNAGRSST